MFRSLITRSLAVKPRFNFAATTQVQQVQKKGQETQKKQITQYVNGELIHRTQLTLKKQEDIEQYVLKLVRGYFRTTNKQGLTAASTLEDHGLDWFDSIELAMQVEEDLGYVISAETIPVLNKVNHFINYIQQVEQFKEENGGKAPLA